MLEGVREPQKNTIVIELSSDEESETAEGADAAADAGNDADSEMDEDENEKKKKKDKKKMKEYWSKFNTTKKKKKNVKGAECKVGTLSRTNKYGEKEKIDYVWCVNSNLYIELGSDGKVDWMEWRRQQSTSDEDAEGQAEGGYRKRKYFSHILYDYVRAREIGVSVADYIMRKFSATYSKFERTTELERMDDLNVPDFIDTLIIKLLEKNENLLDEYVWEKTPDFDDGVCILSVLLVLLYMILVFFFFYSLILIR